MNIDGYTLFGIDITVEVIPLHEWAERTGDMKHDSVGHFHADKALICIRGDLNEQQQQQAFLHEVLHNIWTFLGYEHGTTPHTEQVVDATAYGLHQVLTSISKPKGKKRK